MKTAIVAKAVLILTLAGAGTSALAGDSTVDKSRDVFVNHTILGKWTPDSSSISNDKPDVAKSLAVFGKTVTGQNVRLDNTTGKISNTDVAASVFTHQYQN